MNFWIKMREYLGLTRYAIAKKLGLKQGSWDNLEKGGGRPSLELLVKLKNLSSLSGNEIFQILEDLHGEKRKSRTRSPKSKRPS